MTEDWRKIIEGSGVQKYKGSYYLDGREMKKIIPDEVFFVHQFLTFVKALPGYRLKRSLRDHELDVLSSKDQEKYKTLEDKFEENLQLYLRDSSDKILKQLNVTLKELLLIIIKCLKLREVVLLDEDKISSKYSKIPFTLTKQESDIIYQYEDWESDIKFGLIEREFPKNVKEEKQTLKKEEETYVEEDTESDDLVGTIKRLKRLYKSGTLTKDEFERAKNKLLK
tara:strand:- start:342 stop:1016 length:675 start_codon:yes stop_codon:yes gene_type:complete